MNPDFLSFWIAAFAGYLGTRLIVVADVFDAPRSRFKKWLLRGETQADRDLSVIIFAGSAAFAVLGVIGRFVDGGDRGNNALAVALTLALILLVSGEVVGHRYFVHAGISCKLCVGVWTSGIAAASLSLVNDWPIFSTIIFGLAVGGFQTIIHVAEGWIAAATDRILDDRRRRIEAELAAEEARSDRR